MRYRTCLRSPKPLAGIQHPKRVLVHWHLSTLALATTILIIVHIVCETLYFNVLKLNSHVFYSSNTSILRLMLSK